MKILFAALFLFSTAAYADTILAPGETRMIGKEKVYCSGGSTSPTMIYSCHCGYDFNGFQDFGWATFSTTSQTMKQDALTICKRRAANFSQETLMAFRECSILNVEQP